MAAAAEQKYTFVDDIPELYAARRLVRKDALDILENRRERQIAGLEPELEPVDPLSTAHHVNQASDPLITDKLKVGLTLDCQRLVAEWYRKKRPEYFPVSRHEYDESKQEFFSNGLSIRQMTENALIPIKSDPEEEARRVNEYVEDATPALLRTIGGFVVGKALRTISECTDSAIDSYEFDVLHAQPHRGYRGYVPEIKKLMIRDTTFDAYSNDRLQEQISLPGIYITHEIIQMALERQGITAGDMDKTALHGAQILAEDDILDFVRQLDDVASEQWCTNIYMGEAVEPDHPKNYEAIRSEADLRQVGLVDIATEVANFTLHLDEESVQRSEALELVESYVKIKLGELGKRDADIAEQMFDKKTADRLCHVNELERAGRYDEAERLFTTAIQAAPGGGACGGGSCGLEAVNPLSGQGAEIAKKLNAKAGDTITKDKVRSCKNCGEKQLVYVHNESKVNTWCQGCDSVVKKATKVIPNYVLAA